MPRGKAAAGKDVEGSEAKVKPEKATKRVKTETVAEESASDTAGGDCEVVITSNKACNAFKTRAEEVQRLVQKAKPSAKVLINTEKKLGTNPDKGRFAIEVKGKYVVDCGVMARPFTKMKELSMQELADKVVAEL
jgi:hypothetical protein